MPPFETRFPTPPHVPRFTEESDPECRSFEDLDPAPEPDGEASLEPFPLRSLGSKRPAKSSDSWGSSPRKMFRTQPGEGIPGYPSYTYPSHSASSRPYCQEESHLDPSQEYPSAPASQCPILRKLQMRFGPFGFVCERCGQLCPPQYLGAHIRSKNHAKDLDVLAAAKQRRQVLQQIVSHLLASHGAREDSIFNLPGTIPDTIPGLTPILCYKCPACLTPRWLQWKSLGTHYHEEHKSARRPDKQTMKPRYIVRPYKVGLRQGRGGRSELSNVVVFLPEGWTPEGEGVHGTGRTLGRLLSCNGAMRVLMASGSKESDETTSKVRAQQKRQSPESGESCHEGEDIKLSAEQDLSVAAPPIQTGQTTWGGQLESDPGDWPQLVSPNAGTTHPHRVLHPGTRQHQNDPEQAQIHAIYPVVACGPDGGEGISTLPGGDRLDSEHLQVGNSIHENESFNQLWSGWSFWPPCQGRADQAIPACNHRQF